MPDLTYYYDQVLKNPTARPEAKTEANNYFNRINADSLINPATPIKLPDAPKDTTNYNSMVAGGNAMISGLTGGDSSGMDDLFKKYLGSSTPPPNPADAYVSLYGASGIDEKQKAVNDSQNRIRGLNAQLQGITAEQTAQELQFKNEGISAPAIKTRDVALERQNAIRALPIQAQILAEQATLTGNTALLQQAQQKLDTVFTMQSKYATDLFNYNQNLRDAVFQYADKQQQRQLEAQKQTDDQNYQTFRDQIGYAQSLAKTALDSGQSDLASQITQLDPNRPSYMVELGNLAGQIRANPVEVTAGASLIDPITGRVISTAPKTNASGAKSTSTKDTSTNQSNTLQRILDGVGSVDDLTPTEKKKIQDEAYANGLYENNPPKWFVDSIQNELKQSILPEKLQELWNEYRKPLTTEATSSGGGRTP